MRPRGPLAHCLLCLLTAGACSTGPAYAIGPAPPPAVVSAPAQTAELPPQTFVPAQHQVRQFPTPEAAAFSAIPAVSTRSKCVAAGAVPEGRPGAPPPPKKKPLGGNRDFVRYDDASAKASTATVSPSAPAESEAEAQSPTGVGEAASGTTRLVEAAPSRKQRRKAKRARADQAPPSSSADDVASEQRAPEPDAVLFVEPQWPPAHEGWGGATFLSNDDSMSMSSPQRVRFAIDNELPLPPEHVRPHEILNAASFELAEVEQGHDFSVLAELAPSGREDGLYSLALAVDGRPIGRDGRRNAVVTLVVDRSGSMKAEGRMEFVKRGLLRMVRELKDGDVVNLVTFDHRVCTELQNFVVGRDSAAVLSKAITGIKPSGSTNLHAGLTQGYGLADAAYQPKYTNRVVIITDALANRGVTDPQTLSMVSDFYDARRIRLSGVGVGKTFDDRLLDALTEKGRGAYVFLGSEAQVEHVFGEGFTSLVETTANDVHFRLHLPVTMRLQQFHGEEASVSKAEVQAVHFFADTSQVLLSDIEAWQGQLRPQDGIMLEIEYQHPETGDTMTEAYAFSVAEMTAHEGNVRKAEVLVHFAENLEDLVRNFGDDAGAPVFAGQRSHGPSAAQRCQEVQGELARLSEGLRDAEVADVLRQWSTFCGRFGGAGGRPPRKR